MRKHKATSKTNSTSCNSPPNYFTLLDFRCVIWYFNNSKGDLLKTNFALDLGESTLCRIIRKKGKIGIGFDTRMAGMGSREDVIKHLDLLMEEWQKKNPSLTPTEIADDIGGGFSLVTGGRTYDGFRYFKPVKKAAN